MPAVVGRSYVHVVEEDGHTQKAANTASTECDIEFDIQCDQPCTLREWLYFFFFGMGPGWVMLDGIFVELPWFQSVQPEGLKLASHMTLAAAAALVTSVPLFMTLREYIRYCYILPILTSFSFLLAVTSAFSWSVVIGEVSIAILLLAFVASTLGSMQTVVVIPWMTCTIKPCLVSAVMSGSNFGSSLSAAFSLLQGPGKHQLFSPTIFFMCMSILLFPPTLLYCRIATKRIGMLVTAEKQSDHSKCSTPPECLTEFSGTLQTRQFEGCSKLVLPSFWRQALGLCAINSFLQIFCWSVLRAILPFAAANIGKRNAGNSCDEISGEACTSSYHMGGEVLQYCIEFSYLGVTAGSMSSSLCKYSSARDLYSYVIVFSVLVCIVCSAAIGLPLWQYDGADIVLVTIVVAIRFIDGFLSPLLFRIVAAEFSNECESVSRWIALVEKISTFSSTAIVYIIVEVAA